MFRTLSLGDSKHLSSSEKTSPKRAREEVGLYTSSTKGAGRLNIKDQYQVKEFSILCMGRCKSLESLNSFLSYAPQLPGANPVALFILLLALYSSSVVTTGSGSMHLIPVLGAFIHIWRPENADDCDISCLLTWQEIFSFHRSNS